MSDFEKVYCLDGNRGNDALAYAAMANKNNDPMAMAAMMNGGMNGQWNNPFIYLVWMMFAQRMWNNNSCGQNLQSAEIQSQIQALRSQMADNQNSNLLMDAIKGNASSINQLAANLNCDFNTLNSAICDVRGGIDKLSGQVGFSAERIINAVQSGQASIVSALQNCCCQTQKEILSLKGDMNLGMCQQTNTLQNAINFVNNSVERGFSSTAFRAEQDKCDLIRAGQDNTQRIIDTLNQHWQSYLQQRYNDARLELSQQKQNATLIAALSKTTATA